MRAGNLSEMGTPGPRREGIKGQHHPEREELSKRTPEENAKENLRHPSDCFFAACFSLVYI